MISDDIYDEIQYTKKPLAGSNLSLTSFPILSALLFCELLLPQHPRCPSLHKLFLTWEPTSMLFPLLGTSSPLYSVPSRKGLSRIIFCFELLGPVSASFPIHMAPIVYVLFTSSTWPNRGVWRMLALQMQPSVYSSCVWAEGWKKWGS